jgi:integrase
MASLRKKKYLAALPEGAEIFFQDEVEWARWKDRRGAVNRARVVRQAAGPVKVCWQAKTWSIRFRDIDGHQREISTKCTDKTGALRKLSEFSATQEKRRTGFMSSQEEKMLAWRDVPLATHRADYRDWQTARGNVPNGVKAKDGHLEEMFTKLGWTRLRDLSRAGAEGWVMSRGQHRKSSAATYNAIVNGLHAFGAWLVREGRQLQNPFDGMTRMNDRIDPRRRRRAMTIKEIGALLKAAEERPLAQRLVVWPDMNEVSRERFRAEGRERALIYRVLLNTGLRWGELRSITNGQACLDAVPPFLLLEARNEKNRKGSNIPLRSDLLPALKAHIEARRRNWPYPISDAAWAAVPLFNMPSIGRHALYEDLKWAGIQKRDANGKVLDVHALRHTFGTMLALSGAPLVITQRAMRHFSPDLTANVYTHVGILEVLGAVDGLPSITAESGLVRIAPEGCESNSENGYIPTLCPTNCIPSIMEELDVEQLKALSPAELIQIIIHWHKEHYSIRGAGCR